MMDHVWINYNINNVIILLFLTLPSTMRTV